MFLSSVNILRFLNNFTDGNFLFYELCVFSRRILSLRGEEKVKVTLVGENRSHWVNRRAESVHHSCKVSDNLLQLNKFHPTAAITLLYRFLHIVR